MEQRYGVTGDDDFEDKTAPETFDSEAPPEMFDPQSDTQSSIRICQNFSTVVDILLSSLTIKVSPY